MNIIANAEILNVQTHCKEVLSLKCIMYAV